MEEKKIYFAGSIRGGRDDAGLYASIIEKMKPYGIVLTEHVGCHGTDECSDQLPDDNLIYRRDVQWLISSDVVVAEVTTVSMGVGFEIGMAVAAGKKVLCLYRPQSGRQLSAMIAGCPGIELIYYHTPRDAFSAVEHFLDQNL